MSDYQIKENSGSIFKNSKKVAGDKLPDYNGTINVDGSEKQIALWLKTSDKGTKYFSVKISEPYKKNETVAPSQSNAAQEAKSDSLPF